MGKAYKEFWLIEDAAQTVLQELLARWLPDGCVRNGEWVALNPKRNDGNPGSFKINIRTCKWADFATRDRGRGVISLVSYLEDLSYYDAAQRLDAYLGGV